MIRVRWSPEDQQHIATHSNYPLLSWLADTQAEAIHGLRTLVRDIEKGRA